MGLVRRSASSVEEEVGALSREELAGLVKAAQAVNKAGDIRSILQTILDEAIRLLAADEGSVMLFSSDRSHLRIRAARGLPDDIADNVTVVPGVGIAGYVATSGEPLLLTGDQDVAEYATVGERARRVRSAVSVPLRARGVVEGVLNINRVHRSGAAAEFGERDRALAALFAEHAAAAVHNRQLVGQARQRRDELGRLYEVSYALSTTLDVDEVTHRILDATADLLGAESGFVCVLGEEGNGPEVGVYRGVTRGRVMAVMRRPEFNHILCAGGVRVINDTAADQCLSPLVDEEGVTAVVVPLHTDGEPRGLIVVLLRDRAPSESDLRLLGTYTNHASLALAKALLFRSIRTKETELESLVHAVPDPIIVADSGGRFVAFNPAAAERFGLNPQFDNGTPVAGKLRSGELEELLFSKNGGRAEITLFSPSPRTYRVRVDLVRPDHGLAGARILILEDVTSEKEIAQLQSDFVSVISHELRTPLTLIKGYASTLSRRRDLDEDVRQKSTAAVHTHAVRLERLIEDLLFVANIEQGAPPLTLERHDLVELVDRVVSVSNEEWPERTVVLRSDPTQLEVDADATKIEQILHHLVDNALKFSEAPDPVEVAVRTTTDEVVIHVHDRGVGIFSGDLPRLFDRFRQIDGTATRHHGGTGIGLHICKTLTEAHGGRISVRSALGKGSTFTVRLPRHADGELLAQRSRLTRNPASIAGATASGGTAETSTVPEGTQTHS